MDMEVVNLENIQARLARNEEEHKLLKGLLQQWEDLKRFDGALQLPLIPAKPTANGIKGSMSFPNGMAKVLEEAGGKPMRAEEIWQQMRVIGVVSQAKKPDSFVSLHAKKNPKIESMGKNTFRWVGD